MKKLYKTCLFSWLLVAACLMGVVQGYAQNALTNSTFRAISSEYGVREARPAMNDNGRAINNRGWNYYDDGINVDAIGLTNGGSFYWSVMFPAGSYTGNAVTKVSMYDYAAHTGNIMIYQGGDTAPGTLVYTQAYACTGSANFVEWTLNIPVTVNSSQNLWIVMFNNDGQYVAPVCNDTGNPNGRWISTDGTTWSDLMDVNPDLAYTWMLRACIETINSVWDFESGMNGWTTIDADGDGYTWVLGSAAGGVYLVEGGSLAGTGHNASEDMMCSGSWTNMTSTVLYPDNYLVSPQVTLSAGSTFSFWACAQDSNYPADHFGVFISNNGTSNWTMVNEWTMTTKGVGMMSVGRNGQIRAQGNWHNYSVDLSAYTGQKYIAIRHFNCSDQFLLDIDDIVLSTNIQSYTITVSASPTSGGAPYIGNTSGTTQATYTSGQSCTVHANPTSGYTFTNWTENGIVVSYNTNYTFTVSSSRNLVAHFQAQSQTYTITVSSSPTSGGNPYIGNTPGITQATYTSGQSCTVHANPSAGYIFTNWTVNGSQVSTSADYTFSVTSNRNLVANYVQQHTITVSANPTSGGSVYIGDTPSTTQGTFTHGQSCTVHSVPNNGYSFTNWKENNQVVSNQANYTFTVTSNRNLVAYFTQQQYTITVLANPNNGGTVTGSGAYHYGDQVTLVATANSGFEFVGWNDGNTNNPRIITVTGNATYTAIFVEVGTTYYNVTATVNPAGSGTVTGTGPFPAGSTTQLTAIPNNGYTFNHWQDGNTQNPRTVTVNSNLSFTAYFTQNTYTITTQVSPAGSGTVTGGGSGFHYGDQTILTAVANAGYTFDYWNDGSTQNPRTITVTGNATYTACFTQAGPTEYTITTNVTPEGAGMVNGGGTYPAGTIVNLNAVANEGYTFEHWQDGNSDNPRTITVTGNATYTAVFKSNQYTVTVSANPTSGGSVYISDTPGITQVTYDYDAICTAHASTNTGYTFINWTENGQQVSSSPDYTFNVTGDHNLVANFVEEGACIIYVDIVPEEGGTVIGAGVYSPGDECTLKAFAKPGYKFKNWTMNDVEVSTELSYTFTVTETEYYVAHFEMKKYTIIATSDPSEGGTISGDGQYYYGTTCTLIATPNFGYTFSRWTDDGTVISTSDTYSFTVTDNCHLTAHFDALTTYTISAMSGANGSITPQGDVVVVKGADQTFIMTPDLGGRIFKVMVDGIDIGPLDSYTFTNVNRNHTIYVSFSGMGIEEVPYLNVNIYPNPAKDKVYVEGEGIETVVLYDLLGNCLRNMEYETSKEINVSGLSKGTYVLKLTTQDGRIGYQKLVLN